MTREAREALVRSMLLYGRAYFTATLKAQGYTRKYWATKQDDRVRDSHVQHESIGIVPITHRYRGGVQYPRDPSGPPEEVYNCRCHLIVFHKDAPDRPVDIFDELSFLETFVSG